MVVGLSNQVVVAEGSPPRALTIESWPMRDEPLASSLLLGFAIAVGIAASWIAQNGLTGVACATALLLALRHLWMPAEFQINELGVRRTVLGRSRRTPWREIGGYQIGSTAIAIWPDQEPSLQNVLRGVYIPYGRQRDQLIAIVELYMSRSEN